MFFDPDDYLERGPGAAGAESKRETGRLARAARQRAALCEAMTWVAAERGLEGATIDAAVQRAGLSRGTFYRLYETRDACVLEAFERCADTLLTRVADAVGRGSGDPLASARTGLAELRDLLGSHDDVARGAARPVRSRWKPTDRATPAPTSGSRRRGSGAGTRGGGARGGSSPSGSWRQWPSPSARRDSSKVEATGARAVRASWRDCCPNWYSSRSPPTWEAMRRRRGRAR